MSIETPPFRTLVGRFIRLEPLTRERLPELFAAIGHPVVFADGYGGGPAGLRSAAAEFAAWAEGYYRWTDGQVYAVVIAAGPHEGRLVGTTTLTDFDLANEHAHIGWTAYDPAVWGTAVNPEAKSLLLGHAFEHGVGRVRIQADARNERSRAAIAGIGASFEGIVRRDKPRADGSWRDTALFSVIVDEWPAVRDLLAARLTRLGDDPVIPRAR